MKTLYFECNMGAAGDMLMAALYELLPDKDEFLSQMNHLGIPGLSLTPERVAKCGIYGTGMKVEIHGAQEGEGGHIHHHGHEHSHENHHHHAGYHEILHQISHLDLPEEVKKNAESIYRLIGEAEAKAHNTTLDQIHFHEVGTLDALADVVGNCLLIHMLKPDRILCSPIHVGNGTVSCAHGILPVPAPATAEILTGIPYYSGEIMSELCTPTGAAILKHFAEEFVPHPQMVCLSTGYGMGHKDFPAANCVRAFLLKSQDTRQTDEVTEIQCNLDDITGEALGFAAELLMEQGALDVYTTPVTMKKGRPGILFSCICRPKDLELMSRLIFKHTTTRGLRYRNYSRMVLSSEIHAAETPYGTLRIKESQGYGVCRRKPEYDDLAKIARAQDLALGDIEF